MSKNVSFGKMLHGGDYNPEQWLHMPEILDRDIELMKKASINTVSLGIFSWAVLEPEEGKFDFVWMEQIIDRLFKNGISVILATPTGARPKWMADKYEEVLRVDAMRRRQLFGARHNHCYLLQSTEKRPESSIQSFPDDSEIIPASLHGIFPMNTAENVIAPFARGRSKTG